MLGVGGLKLSIAGSILDHPVHRTILRPYGPKDGDEIQLATERDLAVRNVDRESGLLRDVQDALRRIHGGEFGTCMECESAISPKRLAAVPWAARCIQCQEAADRDRQEGTESFSAVILHAA